MCRKTIGIIGIIISLLFTGCFSQSNKTNDEIETEVKEVIDVEEETIVYKNAKIFDEGFITFIEEHEDILESYLEEIGAHANSENVDFESIKEDLNLFSLGYKDIWKETMISYETIMGNEAILVAITFSCNNYYLYIKGVYSDDTGIRDEVKAELVDKDFEFIGDTYWCVFSSFPDVDIEDYPVLKNDTQFFVALESVAEIAYEYKRNEYLDIAMTNNEISAGKKALYDLEIQLGCDGIGYIPIEGISNIEGIEGLVFGYPMIGYRALRLIYSPVVLDDEIIDDNRVFISKGEHWYFNFYKDGLQEGDEDE